MDRKPIKLTMHTVERGLTHNLDPEDITRIVTEGARNRRIKHNVVTPAKPGKKPSSRYTTKTMSE